MCHDYCLLIFFVFQNGDGDQNRDHTLASEEEGDNSLFLIIIVIVLMIKRLIINF